MLALIIDLPAKVSGLVLKERGGHVPFDVRRIDLLRELRSAIVILLSHEITKVRTDIPLTSEGGLELHADEALKRDQQFDPFNCELLFESGPS